MNVLKLWNKVNKQRLVITILILLGVQVSLGIHIARGSISQEQITVLAKKAPDFIDSIGVEVRLYPEREDSLWTNIIKPRLQELGVQHIRTRLRHNIDLGSDERKAADRIIELGNLDPPIKTTGIWREFGSWDEKIKATEYMLSGLEAIENPNEPNRPQEGFDYKDTQGERHGYSKPTGDNDKKLVGKGWVHAVRLFTEDLNLHIKNNFPQLKILSSAVTIGAYKGVQNYQNQHNWNVEDWVDYGNFHVYRKTNPEKNTRIDDVRQTMYPTKPLIITETGYNTGARGIALVPNQEIQAIYNLRSILEFFRLGIKRTYIFSLLRFEPEPRYFSLIDPDNTEKVTSSFEAIRDTISILDGGDSNFTPQTLRYEITGKLNNLRHKFVLQKSDGKFYLILWLAKPYDASELNRVVNFKLKTPGFIAAKLYQPVQYGTKIVEQIDNPYSSYPLNVSDIPLIVELIPKAH